MSYNDKILARYDASVDDEFERDTFYRSYALFYYWFVRVLILCAGILAWVLPGTLAYWSFILFVPIVVAELAVNRWYKSRSPRPRANKLVTPQEWIVQMILVLFWLAGLIVSSGSNVPDGFVTGIGIGAGGGLIGLLLLLNSSRIERMRQKDRERLDAQLDED